MSGDINKALDDSLSRLHRGESIEQCLDRYPQLRHELEPLLQMAVGLRGIPRPSLSSEFHQSSQELLVKRLKDESINSRQSRFERSRINFKVVMRPLVAALAVLIAALLIWQGIPRWLSPEPIYAAELTLSILRGSAEIQTPGSEEWAVATDGVTLIAGSKVRTADNGYILLTFFDGSTSKLEPDTELNILKSEYDKQETAYIALEQRSGTTWNHVMSNGTQFPEYFIQTSLAKTQAHGTAFSVQVDPTGNTKVEVAEGTVDIIDREDKGLQLTANQQVEIIDKLQTAVVSTRNIENELVITTGNAGIGSVRDPSGASTGDLPNGFAFNQITNSKSSLIGDGQVIKVEQPATGEYAVVIRPLTTEPTNLDIEIKQDRQVVFLHTGVLPVTAGNGWIVRINLTRTIDGAITGKVVSVSPLEGNSPETIVEPPVAKQRAVPLILTTSSENQTPRTTLITTTPTTSATTRTPVIPMTNNTTTTIETTTPPTQSQTTKPSETPSIKPTITPAPTSDTTTPPTVPFTRTPETNTTIIK